MTTPAGKVRRFVLTVLSGGPVEGRRGSCDRCGACCEGCPFHAGDHCTIYPARPLQCRAFPLDARDVAEVGRCAYWFDAGAGLAGDALAVELLGE